MFTIFCPRCKSAETLRGSERESTFYQRLNCSQCWQRDNVAIALEAMDNNTCKSIIKQFQKELRLLSDA